MNAQEGTNVLEQVPSPADVARRLGELARERRLLKRQLKLSMAVYEERELRDGDGPPTTQPPG
jgi:hypothetical protein